ncbi:signal peptide peptidase SppA [Sulfurimonas sp. C5]|uniref:signal peptide peptidase SppA n=1 Tax=Sulfurimonas sp. C5 TaxID=3036947 RepID=UPI0024538CA5|nr:signal peptide peptidase SppA [Sulfurimonas sp. C5]MDH4945344.1 signal peptide peptidase SppA [Sulfurimonas sp. C5]
MEFLKKVFLPITLPIKFIQEHFKASVFVLILFLIFAPNENQHYRYNNLQKIDLVGPIFDAKTVVEQIDKATANNDIKGILLSVDSPGGAVAPSIEIAYAIKRATTKKPVVVYAKGTIASGSYYASIWADKIISNPGSMVGSIGVIMQGADFSELMNKIGIKSQIVKAGKYKQVGTADRAWEDYEINELNKVIQGTYDMFSKDVADARGLDINKRDTYANAHIFTAAQAKEVGLIDQLGVETDAKNELVKLSGVKSPVWNEEDKFEKIIDKLSASTSVMLYTYFPQLTLR